MVDSLLEVPAAFASPAPAGVRCPPGFPGGRGVPASVLLALAPVDGADTWSWCWSAARHLRQHAGQVACPRRGRAHRRRRVAAALRRPIESASTRPGSVLGSLDRAYRPCPTSTCAGGRVWDGWPPGPEPDEVAGSCGRPCASSPTQPTTAPCVQRHPGRGGGGRPQHPRDLTAPCSGSTGFWSGGSPPGCWPGSSTPSASRPHPSPPTGAPAPSLHPAARSHR